MMVLLPYLGIISQTPKAVLAAIVVASVIKEIVWPKALIPLKGMNAVLGWTTAFVTAVTSPTVGIITGCVLSGVLQLVAGGAKSKGA